MTDNTITITLDDVLGPDGLDGAWEGMVQKLAERVEWKFAGFGAERSFHDAAMKAIDTAVETRIAAKLEELLEKPIHKRDAFGEPIGEPTTFGQMIAEAVEAAFSKKVDIYGKPLQGRGNGGDKTLFEHALHRIAVDGLSAEVQKAVRKVNKDAKKAVAQEVARSIAATIR